ncbi:MAG: AI-2E family transporter [Bacteroidales bacterium]
MDRLTKINKILFFTLLTLAILYVGAPFLKPFIFGILLASLMTPFCDFLESKRINRVFSSIISTLVVFIIAGAILFLFVYQLNNFVSEISSFREELKSFINNIQEQIASVANISLEEQSNIWKDRSDQFFNEVESQITQFIGGFVNSVFNFLIVLIYVILLLLYRGKLYDFIMMYIREEKKEDSKEVFAKINTVVFHYLWGRAQVMIILAILYYITFLIFDLPYAVLLTIFGSLITIIPYFGPFVSGLLPIVFSFVFFDSMQNVLLFTIIIITIQLTESYVLEPLIIGKEVKLNPLIVILAVVVGGLIWGIAGMVLFVPLFAMIKIISTHSAGFEPIGFLFGNASESNNKTKTP